MYIVKKFNIHDMPPACTGLHGKTMSKHAGSLVRKPITRFDMKTPNVH
jgi:hypothetical protein